MNWRAFIISCVVTGLISVILISILTGDKYKQDCGHENGIVLKPLPLTIERKVGAVAQVYYKSYCVDCNEYFPHLSSEPNEADSILILSRKKGIKSGTIIKEPEEPCEPKCCEEN